MNNLGGILSKLDRKVVFIFLAVAVLQTISWYYTSRMFFKNNLSGLFGSGSDVQLYEFIYWYAGDFITLLIIPALIIKIFFKENLRDYGFTPGDKRAGLIITLGFLLIMLPVIWIVSSEPSFSLAYPLLASARYSWKIFVIYEAGLFIYLIAWEFIWRGFMLFGLKEKFGYYAVLIQMIPFLILHNGKPPVEVFGAILGGLALGILAFRTNSIYYCVLTHAGVMFAVDLISILRYRADEFGLGLNSFLHIIKNII